MGTIQRVDAWFEVHPYTYMVQTHGKTQYMEWCRKLKKVITLDEWPGFENTMVLPKEALVDKYGDRWFTSSVAWMLAMAIDAKPDKIGIWGIDMAASTEYEWQRPGCQFFLDKATEAGIDLVIPLECDLNEPPGLYGVVHGDNMYRKLQARKKELEGRIAGCKQIVAEKQREQYFLEGGLEDLDYIIKVWSGRTR